MKHLLIAMCVSILLTAIVMTAYADTDTPYPPPAKTSVAQNGASPLMKGPGPTGSEIIADLILVRPISFAAYLVGIGATIVAVPFTLPSGTTCQVCDKLLKEPFDFAVRRPLGEL